MSKHKIEIELTDKGIKNLEKILKYMKTSNVYKDISTESEAIEKALAIWLKAHNIY